MAKDPVRVLVTGAAGMALIAIISSLSSLISQIHHDCLILYPFVFLIRDLWSDRVSGLVWWFWILGLCQNYVSCCVWILICLCSRSDALMNDDDVLCVCVVIGFGVDLFVCDLFFLTWFGLGFICNCLRPVLLWL